MAPHTVDFVSDSFAFPFYFSICIQSLLEKPATVQ